MPAGLSVRPPRPHGRIRAHIKGDRLVSFTSTQQGSATSSMQPFARSAAFAVVGLSATALAAIGPVTDLHIVNADIAPDGISRAAVLAGGTFPGPLIVGNKVTLSTTFLYNHCSRGCREITSKSTS